MLVRVVVRACGAISEGVNGAIEAAFPTIDILAVSFEFDSRLGNTIFLSVVNQ